jgi:hypothetical protein
MPARPRQGRRIPRRDLTEHQWYQLATGHAWFAGFASAADMQAGWEHVRETLLAWHITHCPGSRPWAWWQLEAPAPRQLVHGMPHTCAPRQQHPQWWYGVPRVYGCARCWDEAYESQARYLRRVGRLTPQDAAVVPAALAACDVWFTTHYPETDHPTPGMTALRALVGV